MLKCWATSPRHAATLAHEKGKVPASTKIGRKVFYELNELQEWIDRGKKPVMSDCQMLADDAVVSNRRAAGLNAQLTLRCCMASRLW